MKKRNKNFKRTNFCGPAGDGKISEFFSNLIDLCLIKLKLDLQDACENHDIDWEDGPNTVDDIKFALKVYESVKEQKNGFLAGIISFVGFIFVRVTAIIYKHF